MQEKFLFYFNLSEVRLEGGRVSNVQWKFDKIYSCYEKANVVFPDPDSLITAATSPDLTLSEYPRQAGTTLFLT